MNPRILVALMLAATVVLTPAGWSSTVAADHDDPAVTTYRNASGLVVSTVRQGGSTFTSYGVPIADVDVEVGTDSETATVQFEETPHNARSATIRPTVYEMSLEAGMNPDEACAFARGFDPGGCRTSARIAQRASGAGAVRTARASIYDSRCYKHETTAGDGTKYNYACNIRRLHGRSKRLDRAYLSNQMKATAWSEDPGALYDRINGAGVQAAYGNATAHAIDWAPHSTIEVGRCQDVTTTVTTRQGASVSTTNTVCKNKLGPWHSPAFQYFGAKWTGPRADEGDTRGVVATSLVQVPYYFWNYRIRTWLRWT